MKKLLDKVWFNMIALGIYVIVIPMLMAWGIFSLLRLITGTQLNDYGTTGILFQFAIFVSYVIIFAFFKKIFKERSDLA